MNIRYLIYPLVVTLWLIGDLYPVHNAQANTSTPATFSATPILPADNAAQATYFRFTMHPKQQRTLKIKITNQGQQTAQYDVIPRVASTNSNGILDYGHDNHDSQLPAQSNTLFKPSRVQVVTVPARYSKMVTLKLKAPRKSFSGIMLAGITVSHHRSPTVNHPSHGIIATTEYVTAVEFYNQRPQANLHPQLVFKQAHYHLVQAQPQLSLAINNHAPSIASQGYLNAILLDHTGKKVCRFVRNQLMFAPQSQFELNLDLKQQQLSAGNYTLVGNLTTRGQVAHRFKLPLIVTPQTTANVRRNAAKYSSKLLPDWLLYSGIVLFAALIGASGVLVTQRWRRHRHTVHDHR